MKLKGFFSLKDWMKQKDYYEMKFVICINEKEVFLICLHSNNEIVFM